MSIVYICGSLVKASTARQAEVDPLKHMGAPKYIFYQTGILLYSDLWVITRLGMPRPPWYKRGRRFHLATLIRGRPVKLETFPLRDTLLATPTIHGLACSRAFVSVSGFEIAQLIWCPSSSQLSCQGSCISDLFRIIHRCQDLQGEVGQAPTCERGRHGRVIFLSRHRPESQASSPNTVHFPWIK